ncbi:MAG: phenylalanine--tRNA ligase subunit beta [Sphingomonas sp.]|nr:phenylalanine--tRNA ligase subunit beta [Sphingomonas sp.]
MKFSLSWLRAHLDSDWPAQRIADTLTAIGLEVEGLSNPADALAPFKVAKVLSAAKHPQADKLQVLSVDAGDGPVQVVCGAPNAHAGMLGVFGPPGAFVPGSGMTLKVAAIRGVESHGMMCSVRELELGDEHDGIIELPADAPVGAAFAEYARLDDIIFDVAITPDRQDCMGVRGIARDLAAAGAGTLRPLEVAAIDGAFDCAVPVTIQDPAGCPAFYGRAITGLTNGTSPEWMQQRLKAAGQRPISALVDITNYIMLDLGRPAHAYDIAKLAGGLTARAAKPGETVLALNEKSYSLEPFMTVIADDKQVHDIGGIMGGEDSGVSAATVAVMLEIAFFTPENIARTGQALALTSDARSRFERGVDPAFLDDGLAILTGLVLDICGGEASKVIRAGQAPIKPKTISFDFGHTLALGGIDVPEADQKAIFERLGFGVKGHDITVPTWRRDVDGSADLVEEVVRITGYDSIISTPLDRAPGVAHATATGSQLAERRVRRAAAARGLNEAITWSFISEAESEAVGGGEWIVANPISEEMKVMRPSLLPGLAAAARRNLDRGAGSVRLFELGRRYDRDSERQTVAILLAGDRGQRDWRLGKPRTFDAFDVKALVFALLEAAGAPVSNLQSFANAGPQWHPGRSASLGLGPKTIVARFGEVHPQVLRQLDVPAGAVAAEIYLDAIPEPRSSSRARSAFVPPALQSVARDFAFIVPPGLAAGDLVRAIRGSDKAAITDARLFDRFESSDGQSLAIEVTMQPTDKSFTDEEIGAISKAVIAAAEKLGARLRG